MRKRLYLCVVLTLLFSGISACSNAPVGQRTSYASPYDTSTPQLRDARTFLTNIGAGELGLLGYEAKLSEVAKEQPGMAELTKRALADMTAQDIIDLMADIYTRHLTPAQLRELAQLSDNDSVRELYRSIRWNLGQGKELESDEMMKKLSASQLDDILQFTQSDSLFALNLVLPEINHDTAKAAKLHGEAKLIQYLKAQ